MIIKNKQAIYIAGPITGRDNYKEAFRLREQELNKQGYIVLNPARLPEGLHYEAYMPICYAMIDAAQVLYMMPGWQSSMGANRELGYATAKGYKIIQEEMECLK